MQSTYRADCERCVGLCCVAAPFQRSADFALTKPAGVPCPHLGTDHRCTIHAQLQERGFPGCVSFDCYGAGQRVTARHPAPPAGTHGATPRAALFDDFHATMGVCELGWHLDAARARPDLPPRWHAALDAAGATVQQAAEAPGDVRALRDQVSALLSEVSRSIRSVHGPLGPDHSRAMLAGRSFRGRSLARGSLFAACLVGADLRGADLRHADLRGTDLRGADLRGAHLEGVLFLTPGQRVRARVS